MPTPDQIGAFATLISALAVLAGAIRLGRSKVRTDDLAKVQGKIVDLEEDNEKLRKTIDEAEAHEIERDLERDRRERQIRSELDATRRIDLIHRVYEHQLKRQLIELGADPAPTPAELHEG